MTPDMTEMTTTDVELRVRDPGSIEPDAVISGDDFTFDLSDRVGRRKDTGSFTIRNGRGQHTDVISSGSRLDVVADLGQTTYDTIDQWGDETWGEFIWPGERRIWTAMARTDEIDRQSFDVADYTVEAEDFALGVMAKRDVQESFDEQTVLGILRKLIDRNAAELTFSADRGGRLLETTSATFDGETLYEAFDRIVSRADAVVHTHGAHVHVEPFELPPTKFTVDARRDFDTTTRKREDDDLANLIQIHGPVEPILDEYATLDEQAGYWTVRSEAPTHFQVPTQKSEIGEIELWTRNINDTAMTVRLQRNDDGAPVNVDDESFDIARHSLEPQFISEDGWTTFLMPEHTLPEPNPRVIIEVDEDSQEIGLSEDGRVSRKVYFPVPVTAQSQDTRSIRNFRQREDRLKLDNIDSNEARDRARTELRRRSTPDTFVECDAQSYRMHSLRPGEVVEWDYPRDDIVGRFMLLERTDAFEGAMIDTTLSFQSIESY